MATPEQREKPQGEEAVKKIFDILVPPGERTDPKKVEAAIRIAAGTQDNTPED